MGTIPTILLLALPASGKSEIRRYLARPDPSLPRLPIGPTIQLDDYPYVHVMRRISEEQSACDVTPTFFASPASSFTDPRDWLTLTHLLAADLNGLGIATGHDPGADALIARIDRARRRAGIDSPSLPDQPARVAAAIAGDAADVAASLPVVIPDRLAGATVIVEFARGGPDGADVPLPRPLGYRWSLAALPADVLRRAVVFYVWVTPEESRRRNRERALAGPDGDASILHHGVPEQVMRADYGMDDMGWLEATAAKPETISVDGPDGPVAVPMARFDNRVDGTSFLRDEPSTWDPSRVADLHARLAGALDALDRRRSHPADTFPPAE
jgi:hypothetical protein